MWSRLTLSLTGKLQLFGSLSQDLGSGLAISSKNLSVLKVSVSGWNLEVNDGAWRAIAFTSLYLHRGAFAFDSVVFIDLIVSLF